MDEENMVPSPAERRAREVPEIRSLSAVALKKGTQDGTKNGASGGLRANREREGQMPSIAL
ncbi:hypothetical protein, partial [Parvibaculum sp.]|uniref:hypothetical protein n=1 Tax=Parvibaculum sp. TaxID=2024848 RepID=UPI002600CD7F